VGVSGVIAPDGTLLQSTRLFTADQLVTSLPLRTSLTPAVRLGGAPALAVGLLAAALVVAGVAGSVRERRRTAAGVGRAAAVPGPTPDEGDAR